MHGRHPAPGRRSGFTLVELLVAMTIFLTLTGALFALVAPAQRSAQAQQESGDLQQRLRVAADALSSDLLMAGAGTYSGSPAGPLHAYLAPILPYRIGVAGANPPLTFAPDRLTVIFVPATASQTALSLPLSGTSADPVVQIQPGCPIGHATCGFVANMRALIYDDTGAFDPFTVTSVDPASGSLQHAGPNPSFSKPYSPADGARITEAVTHTYYHDAVNAQLRRYDGYQSDAPVVDNVVGLSFRYFGDPRPPRSPKPPAGTANCLYDVNGVPTMGTLSGSVALVELAGPMLTDGPLCGAGAHAFDADLLRVRQVRVVLRVQVASAELRGVDPALFRHPGTAGAAERLLPDREVVVDITPRNMSSGR